MRCPAGVLLAIRCDFQRLVPNRISNSSQVHVSCSDSNMGNNKSSCGTTGHGRKVARLLADQLARRAVRRAKQQRRTNEDNPKQSRRPRAPAASAHRAPHRCVGSSEFPTGFCAPCGAPARLGNARRHRIQDYAG